jgi:hypothetical protein
VRDVITGSVVFLLANHAKEDSIAFISGVIRLIAQFTSHRSGCFWFGGT